MKDEYRDVGCGGVQLGDAGESLLSKLISGPTANDANPLTLRSVLGLKAQHREGLP
jgi:hypothetical protein